MQIISISLWPEGTISLSWSDGPFEQFVDSSKEMAAKESQAKHIVAQPFVQINGKRAVSEASLILLVRGGNGHLEIDLTTYARFYDLLEKREGGWRIKKRTAIYEKDRMDCVQPMTLQLGGVSWTNPSKHACQCPDRICLLFAKAFRQQEATCITPSRRFFYCTLFAFQSFLIWGRSPSKSAAILSKLCLVLNN